MTKQVNAKKRLRKRAKRPIRVRMVKKKARKTAAKRKTKKITAASKFIIKLLTSDRRRDSTRNAVWKSSSRS